MIKKKFSSLVLASLMILGGCMKEEADSPAPNAGGVEIDFSAPSFTAEILGQDNLKSALDSKKKIFWTNGDRLSIFDASIDNLQYVFTGETGSRTGILQKVADGSSASGAELDAKYAVYPYSGSTSVSGDGVLSVTLPAAQTYCSNSFGPGANIMTAVSTGNDFNFKNAGCYLVVRLYGDVTVRKIVLTSTDGEKLSGDADISFVDGVPVLTMRESASTSVTLDCGAGVKLGKTSAKATDFWFVLPPVTFVQGFTIQVVCDEGSFAKQKITSGTIRRNEIISISPFRVTASAGKYLEKIKDSEIWNEDKVMSLAKSMVDNFDDYEKLVNTAISSAKLLGLIESSDIKLSRIKYTTTDPCGNVIEASGIVAFPTSIPATSLIDKSTSYDKIVSLQHITCDIDDAPSAADTPFEAAIAFKKGNDVVVLADYLGYGASRTGDLQHPYIHNEKTGTACADLIEAAQEYVLTEGLTQDKNWKIDLVGYSQGGAATISTLLELEKRGYSNIGDVYAGGAPLDLPTFLNKFISEKYYVSPCYLPYLVRGMIYGDRLDVDIHNIFAEEVFTGGAYEMFSTVPDVGDWNSKLSRDLTKVIHPDFFVEGYNGNADIIKLINSLDYNSCSRYTPVNKSKIKLYHSPKDNAVIYDSAKNAADAWGISIHNLEKESHEDAGIEFFGLYFSEKIWNLVKDNF